MPQREYVDFNLLLARSPDDTLACRVSVLPSPAVGEWLEPVDVPREQAPQSSVLDQLQAKTITPRGLVALGRQMAACLLPEGPVRDLYRAARARAGYEGGLRLRLIISDPLLRTWPWEYTYLDPPGAAKDTLDGFLALDPRVSFIRHEPLALPHAQVQRQAGDLTELHMLAAAAQPVGSLPLGLEREIGNLTTALDSFEVEGVRLVLDPVMMNPTPNELEARLRAPGSVALFHFSGHGMLGAPMPDPLNRGGRIQPGFLILVRDAVSLREAPVEAADLARWLLRAGVRLVFLNACQSAERQTAYPWAGVAGALVAHEVPAVIGMQAPVETFAAVSFASAFYGALFSGLSLDEAVSVGRLAMLRPLDQPYFAEWGVPVLYSRLADGVLFPERAGPPTPTALVFRKAVDFQAAVIERGGSLVGLDVQRLASGVKVTASLQNVEGSATVADIRSVDVDANLDIQTTIGHVAAGGTVTILKTDVL
jgi:hypothetical protein